MKMVLTTARSPDEYVAALAAMGAWQQRSAIALRAAVHEAAPQLQERLHWGHLTYFLNGSPVLLIRAEPQRMLFGFWQGQRLRAIEPRLRPGGKYEMATLHLQPDTPLQRATALRLVARAAQLASR